MSTHQLAVPLKKAPNPWMDTILWMVKWVVILNVTMVAAYLILQHYDIVG